MPSLILSDNWPEFKNQLMDNVLHKLGIDCIFTVLYHLHSNRKLEVFQKHLKSTLKKVHKNNPDNWDKYINQVLASYCVTPHLATAETSFFPVYGRYPNLIFHQLLEPIHQFLGDPESGHLDLEIIPPHTCHSHEDIR